MISVAYETDCALRQTHFGLTLADAFATIV